MGSQTDVMAFRLNASFSYGTYLRREGKVCVLSQLVVVVVSGQEEEAGERTRSD